MRDFIASQNSERLRQRLARGVQIREPAAFARLARSLIDMALVTGIVSRLYRAVVLSRVDGPTGAWVAMTLGFGALFLLGMVTIHLSRFSMREWLWRAPGFAVAEALVEMVVSLVLIALSREPLGTGAAGFHDWPLMAGRTLIWRVLVISIFALLLAGIVKWVRFMILRREHAAWSEGTVRAGIPGEDFVERRRRT